MADEDRVQVGHEVRPGLLEEPVVVGVDHDVVQHVVVHVAQRRHDQTCRGLGAARGRRRDRVVLQRVVRGDLHAQLGGYCLDLLLHEVGLAVAHDLERHGLARPVAWVEVLGAVEGGGGAVGQVDPVQPALVGDREAAPVEDDVGRDGGQDLLRLGLVRAEHAVEPGAHQLGWRVDDDAVAQVDGQAGGGMGRDVAREEGHEAQVREEAGDATSFHPLERVELVECHEELQRRASFDS